VGAEITGRLVARVSSRVLRGMSVGLRFTSIVEDVEVFLASQQDSPASQDCFMASVAGNVHGDWIRSPVITAAHSVPGLPDQPLGLPSIDPAGTTGDHCVAQILPVAGECATTPIKPCTSPAPPPKPSTSLYPPGPTRVTSCHRSQ